VIKDLLVEQFNYISAEEIRAMNMRGEPTSTAPANQTPAKQANANINNGQAAHSE
jgi:hypothetical protein